MGDAYVTLTAPFYVEADPLDLRAPCTLPDGDDLDDAGALVRCPNFLGSVLRGTLTYQEPVVDVLTCFVGAEPWCERVKRRLGELLALHGFTSTIDRVDVVGMLFPDGYGSVAVRLHLPGGWDPSGRAEALAAIGPDGRELVAAELRSWLMVSTEQMLRRCGAGVAAEVGLPYFNAVYAGRTDHPVPGRATLDDELRRLVNPDSPMPLTSRSPWYDEFFYAGYAYNALAAPDPLPNLEKLTHLLLVTGVLYARLARCADAAEAFLRNGARHSDVDGLRHLELRLRSEFQSLVAPTFSFDPHTLALRDAVLRSWHVDRLQSRTDNLLAMVRSSVERELAEEQARRIRRVNLIVTVLTAVATVASVEAAIAIYDRFWM